MNNNGQTRDGQTAQPGDGAATAGKPLSGRTVLLVESHALIAMDMSDILQENGASMVRIAAHVAQAAEFVAAAQPDLAILSLPEQRAPVLELARKLMAAHIPCIFFCTDGEALRDDTAFSEVPILTKPVSGQALDTVLSRMF